MRGAGADDSKHLKASHPNGVELIVTQAACGDTDNPLALEPLVAPSRLGGLGGGNGENGATEAQGGQWRLVSPGAVGREAAVVTEDLDLRAQIERGGPMKTAGGVAYT